MEHARPAQTAIERGTLVGRYVVLGALGKGAMGSVYTAFDPDLDRRVALKVVPPRACNRPTDLSREARVLAKIEHPNVATIFDVGFWEDQLFIAMERVEGADLEAWLRAPRATREILEVLLQAGRGLQAAHARGVVHRDFKPSNVLVGEDGRVRVADFGLARLGGDDAVAPKPGDSMRGVFESLLSIAGTPAYMAPELGKGGPTTPRSDQYSFCVAAHWALSGEFPQEGTAAQLPVRAEIRRAITRGLSPDPAQRFDSMEVLLRGFDETQRRRRLWFVGGTAIGVLGGVAGVVLVGRSGDDGHCARRLEAFSERYPEMRRDALRDVLESAPVPYAKSSASRVAAGLDTFARDWTTTFEASCGIQPRIVECLEAQHGRYDALWVALERGGTERIEHAASAVAGLPQPLACASDDVPPPSPAMPVGADDRVAVAEIQEHIERAKAFRATAQFHEAMEDADAAVEAAKGLAHPPLIADALVERGRTQSDLGEFDEARKTFEAAASVAWRSRYDEPALVSIAELLQIEGHGGDDVKAAEVWLEIGRATAERQPWKTRGVADYWNAAGAVDSYAGRWKQARSSYERAFEIRQALLRPDDPALAESLINLAAIDRKEGKLEAAVKGSRAGLELLERALGDEHPSTGEARGHYGGALCRIGRFAEALDEMTRAYDDVRASLGDEHPSLAALANGIGVAHYSLRQYEEAIPYFEQAIEQWTTLRGADDFGVGQAHNSVALSASVLGDHDAALEHGRRSLEIVSKALGEMHPKTASAHRMLSDVLRRAGRCDEAVVEARRVLEILDQSSEAPGVRRVVALGALGRSLACVGELDAAERVLRDAVVDARERLPPTHPDVRTTLALQADVLRQLGRKDEALAAVNAALAIDGPAADMASARLTLAHLLRERDPAQAIELARQVLAALPETDAARTKRGSARELIEELGGGRTLDGL